MKPDEQAKEIYNINLYFCANRNLAKEASIFWVQKIINLKLKMDDKIYWILVKDELFKLDTDVSYNSSN